jgi:predicted nucleic acid-binding protein
MLKNLVRKLKQKQRRDLTRSNIIIDSNVLFSALLKDSLTRKIILEYDGFFLFPSFIFEETEKYKVELLRKSKMKKKDFELLLWLLLQKVKIIETESLIPYEKEAYELVKDIDVNDTIFFACALAYPNSIVWSDDKKLKNQTKIKVVNTSEIYSLLFKELKDNFF